jgi:hypothetical protein
MDLEDFRGDCLGRCEDRGVSKLVLWFQAGFDNLEFLMKTWNRICRSAALCAWLAAVPWIAAIASWS